jgi:hypothetical protein
MFVDFTWQGVLETGHKIRPFDLRQPPVSAHGVIPMRLRPKGALTGSLRARLTQQPTIPLPSNQEGKAQSLRPST